MKIRQATSSDLHPLATLRHQLWPEGPLEEHLEELDALLSGSAEHLLPTACFVASNGAELIGFVEVSLRSHADGCNPNYPVGFIEGWLVQEKHQRKGVGRALIDAAEAWAASRGAKELASDTWADNLDNQRAHQALGFEEVDRCVNYRRKIASHLQQSTELYYARILSKIHHQYFGQLAQNAALELIDRLSKQQISSGQIVELAVGSGISAGILLSKGYRVTGVDISLQMLNIARKNYPSATFEQADLWQYSLDSCAAVTAIGEAVNYLNPQESHRPTQALRDRFQSIYQALKPGGIFLFDCAHPGRSGPNQERTIFWQQEDCFLALEESENTENRMLERQITCFRKVGIYYQKEEETHRLALFDAHDILEILHSIGFQSQVLASYHKFDFLPGWQGFVAIKPR